MAGRRSRTRSRASITAPSTFSAEARASSAPRNRWRSTAARSRCTRANGSTCAAIRWSHTLQYGNWYKHAFYYSLPIYEGTGTAKVSTIDTVTQFVTGTHSERQQSRRLLPEPREGFRQLLRVELPEGHSSDQNGVRLPVRRISAQAGQQRRAATTSSGSTTVVPFQIDTFNYPVRPANDNHYLGLYVQDSWNFNRRLTLSLGLRYAYDNAYAPPQCNVPSEFGAAQCWDKIQMRIWHSWVPRVHAAFDLFGDGKSVIKGGFGRFVNLREVNPEVVTANRNNRATSTWVWRDLNNNRNYDRGEVNLDPNGPDFRAISGVTDAVPNPNENQPKSDEWSLTFERELVSNWSCTSHRSVCQELQSAPAGGDLSALLGLQHSHHERGSRSRRQRRDDRRRSEVPSPTGNILPALTGRQFRRHDAGQLAGIADLQDHRSGGNEADVEPAGRPTCRSRSPRLDSPFDDRQPLNPNSEINTANEYLGVHRRRFQVVTFCRSTSSRRRTSSAGRGRPQARQHAVYRRRRRFDRSCSTSSRSAAFAFRARTSSTSVSRSGLRIGTAAHAGGAFRFLQRVQRELRDGQESAVGLDLPRSDQHHPAADSAGRGDVQLLGRADRRVRSL